MVLLLALRRGTAQLCCGAQHEADGLPGVSQAGGGCGRRGVGPPYAKGTRLRLRRSEPSTPADVSIVVVTVLENAEHALVDYNYCETTSYKGYVTLRCAADPHGNGEVQVLASIAP